MLVDGDCKVEEVNRLLTFTDLPLEIKVVKLRLKFSPGGVVGVWVGVMDPYSEYIINVLLIERDDRLEQWQEGEFMDSKVQCGIGGCGWCSHCSAG